MILSKIHTSCFHEYNLKFSSPSSRAGVGISQLHNSQLHLPLLECCQWQGGYSWEVVWRPSDRGTESTSGSLPGNTYTIHHLDSFTIYTVTVTATNVAGTTDSTPILFSTGTKLFCCYNTFSIVPSINNTLNTSPNSCECSETDHTPVITGGIVAVVLILSITTAMTIIVIMLAKIRNNGAKTEEQRLATVVVNC